MPTRSLSDLRFAFFLKDNPQFRLLKEILAGWQTAHVNIALKQTFDDDFMLNEMDYYQTPTI